MALKRLKTIGNAHSSGKMLAGGRAITVAKGIAQTQLQAVLSGCLRQVIQQGFEHDPRLRHAKTPERSRHRPVCMHSPPLRPIVRDPIGTGGMHGHTVGDRRPPARIGAGVEVTREFQRGQPTFVVATQPRRHPAGMALRRGSHGLCA